MKTELREEDVETKVDRFYIEETIPVTISVLGKDENKVFYTGYFKKIGSSSGDVSGGYYLQKEREIINVKKNKQIKEKRKKEWKIKNDYPRIIIYKGSPVTDRHFKINETERGWKTALLDSVIYYEKISLSDELLNKIFQPQIEQIMEAYKDYIQAFKEDTK